MKILEFDRENADAVLMVQRVITTAIVPFRQRIEAALVVMALVRCARILVRLYPQTFQDQLVPVLCAYLQNAPAPVDAEEGPPIWMPETMN